MLVTLIQTRSQNIWGWGSLGALDGCEGCQVENTALDIEKFSKKEAPIQKQSELSLKP